MRQRWRRWVLSPRLLFLRQLWAFVLGHAWVRQLLGAVERLRKMWTLLLLLQLELRELQLLCGSKLRLEALHGLLPLLQWQLINLQPMRRRIPHCLIRRTPRWHRRRGLLVPLQQRLLLRRLEEGQQCRKLST